MWWPFKKKETKKPASDSRFQFGDPVYFKHRGDRTVGRIYDVYAAEDGSVLYEVQVGGQCPYVLHDMKEEELTLLTTPQ